MLVILAYDTSIDPIEYPDQCTEEVFSEQETGKQRGR